MKAHLNRLRINILRFVFLFTAWLVSSTSFGQGGEQIDYQGSHSTGAYQVTIMSKGAFSERSTSWYMDVSRDDKVLFSEYVFRPFYAWTCVRRGKAKWISKSVLHFRNLSAQGRNIDATLQNNSGQPVSYAEVWIKSIDKQGYPHSPSICLFLEIKNTETLKFWPEIFPGAEYFEVSCEFKGNATSRLFKIPAKRGWPHDIDLDDPKKRIVIKLTDKGPVVHGGTFESLTSQQAKILVPDGPRLHLSEKRREPFEILSDKKKTIDP